MGHIRLGRLPKTRKWSGVFDALGFQEIDPALVSQAVADSAQDEFQGLKGNRAVNYYFWLLVRIATASRGNDFTGQLQALGIDLSSVNSATHFIQAVSRFADQESRKRGASSAFIEMSSLSLRSVLSEAVQSQTQSLFGTSLHDVRSACKRISTKKTFSVASRAFFANLMGRILTYVVDKELSNFVGEKKPFSAPQDAADFHNALHEYCFESARIVEDFSGGWFSKHNFESNERIGENDTLAFTAYALEKLQSELQMEPR